MRMRIFLLSCCAVAVIAAGVVTLFAGHPASAASHDAALMAWAGGGPSPLTSPLAVAASSSSMVVYLGTAVILIAAMGARVIAPHGTR